MYLKEFCAMKKAVSFKTQFILFITFFLIVIFSVITVLFSTDNIKSAIQIFTDNGTPILEAAAKVVDADAFENLAKSKDTGNDTYKTLCYSLLRIKQTSNCRYLYSMAPVRGTTFQYVIDGSAPPSDEENFSPLGTEEDIASYGKAPFEAMENGVITSSLAKQDLWGWTFSVYTPIEKTDGTVVGFIACDFDARTVISLLRRNIIRTTVICLILLVAGLYCIIVFFSNFIKRMMEVNSAMLKVAEGNGDLTLTIPVTRKDETGLLAESCNSLTGKLRLIISDVKHSKDNLSQSGDSMSSATGYREFHNANNQQHSGHAQADKPAKRECPADCGRSGRNILQYNIA